VENTPNNSPVSQNTADLHLTLWLTEPFEPGLFFCLLVFPIGHHKPCQNANTRVVFSHGSSKKRVFGKKWIDGGTDPFPVLCETIKNKITRKREIPIPIPYYIS